jgi:hypothetical protein
MAVMLLEFEAPAFLSDRDRAAFFGWLADVDGVGCGEFVDTKVQVKVEDVRALADDLPGMRALVTRYGIADKVMPVVEGAVRFVKEIDAENAEG